MSTRLPVRSSQSQLAPGIWRNNTIKVFDQQYRLIIPRPYQFLTKKGGDVKAQIKKLFWNLFILPEGIVDVVVHTVLLVHAAVAADGFPQLCGQGGIRIHVSGVVASFVVAT